MMQRVVGASVAVALLSVVSLVVVTTWQAALTAPGAGGQPVTLDGQPVRNGPEDFVHADWGTRQILVLRLPTVSLSATTASIALDVGRGESLVAYDAKSTFLGCTVGFVKDLRGGTLMDPCHQGQWDPHDMARPYHGTAAPEPLPAYKLSWRDGTLWAEAL